MVVFLPVTSVHMQKGQNLPLSEHEIFILRATRRIIQFSQTIDALYVGSFRKQLERESYYVTVEYIPRYCGME